MSGSLVLVFSLRFFFFFLFVLPNSDVFDLFYHVIFNVIILYLILLLPLRSLFISLFINLFYIPIQFSLTPLLPVPFPLLPALHPLLLHFYVQRGRLPMDISKT